MSAWQSRLEATCGPDITTSLPNMCAGQSAVLFGFLIIPCSKFMQLHIDDEQEVTLVAKLLPTGALSPPRRAAPLQDSVLLLHDVALPSCQLHLLPCLSCASTALHELLHMAQQLNCSAGCALICRPRAAAAWQVSAPGGCGQRVIQRCRAGRL